MFKTAEDILIKRAQASEYQNEIDRLGALSEVGQKSSLIKLNPILDENGTLRVGGRLHYHCKFRMMRGIRTSYLRSTV